MNSGPPAPASYIEMTGVSYNASFVFCFVWGFCFVFPFSAVLGIEPRAFDMPEMRSTISPHALLFYFLVFDAELGWQAINLA